MSYVIASWESSLSRTIMGSVTSQIEFVCEEVQSVLNASARCCVLDAGAGVSLLLFLPFFSFTLSSLDRLNGLLSSI